MQQSIVGGVVTAHLKPAQCVFRPLSENKRPSSLVLVLELVSSDGPIGLADVKAYLINSGAVHFNLNADNLFLWIKEQKRSKGRKFAKVTSDCAN